jgi:hypothetical protein
MRKHTMVYEGGGGKRKKIQVKTTKKSSVVTRKVKAVRRQAWNVLGFIGIVTVAIYLFQFVVGGG